MKTTRRKFLKATGAAGIALGALGTTQACALSNRPAMTVTAMGSGRPRRVIFLVSDGMSTGCLSLADAFSRMVRGRGTHFYELLKNKKASRGFFLTHSLNSLVTDSAAASSAWGSGSRVFNGALNMLPDGETVTPIHWLVADKGYVTGLGTTATVTHATPAGFASAVDSRNDEATIAEQYLGRVDVLLGGGKLFFHQDLRDDDRDLAGEYVAKGYAHWTHRNQVIAQGETPDKILGLFENYNVPYTIDQKQSEKLTEEIPTLAEMTRAALASLEKNPKGFLLQVEGALVDWAAHWNDSGALLWDQLAFDDAVGVCLEFVERNPDTLIVVTSDHGNANPGLNGMGPAYINSDESFARLAKSKASYYQLLELLGEDKENTDPALIQELVLEHFGVEVKDEHAEILAAARAERELAEIHVQQRSFTGQLGQVIGNHTGIGWTGSTHTEDITVIGALGPGQEDWAGIIKNTDAFALMASHFGIDHRNRSMTPEQAREFASLAPKNINNHWA
ncbi:MAG: alkaline phosphatase [Candidatus Sumerlaeia bacterium]|nr:alkaline phosphatase [Candidatus Sumerlaeia bacterium]